MGLVALLLAALAGWLIWTGRLQRMSAKDGMALGTAIVGAVMAAKGKPLAGAPLLIGAAIYFLGKSRLKGRSRPTMADYHPPRPDDVVKARALLGVPAGADAQAIRAAHRRLIASVHPDKGGTEALAAQINAARDVLLAATVEREEDG